MMHILNLGRRFTPCVEGCRKGIWPSTVTGNELDGKTVGLAGYGRVAKNLARMISGFSSSTSVGRFSTIASRTSPVPIP